MLSIERFNERTGHIFRHLLFQGNHDIMVGIGTVDFGVSTHSVPIVDLFFRVEWTAAFPLWTLNLAQRDTVHGARCALPPTSSCLYQLACTGTDTGA